MMNDDVGANTPRRGPAIPVLSTGILLFFLGVASVHGGGMALSMIPGLLFIVFGIVIAALGMPHRWGGMGRWTAISVAVVFFMFILGEMQECSSESRGI